MGNDELLKEIVSELRKLRRMSLWTSVLALAVLVVFIGSLIVVRFQERTADPWNAVTKAVRQMDYNKAIALAQEMTKKHPQDYYGYEYLGIIYLAKGDAVRAEKAYARAYELFPSEDLGKQLSAIRKRIATEKPEKK